MAEVSALQVLIVIHVPCEIVKTLNLTIYLCRYQRSYKNCWLMFKGFPFLVIFSFILGRAVDQAGLTASFRAHVNIVFLLTYLLI